MNEKLTVKEVMDELEAMCKRLNADCTSVKLRNPKREHTIVISYYDYLIPEA